MQLERKRQRAASDTPAPSVVRLLSHDDPAGQLMVGCAKVQLSDGQKEDYDMDTPGIMHRHAKSYPECERRTFPISKGIVLDNNVYCSDDCAQYTVQHLLQRGKLKDAERHIKALLPGDWTVVWDGQDNCDRCGYAAQLYTNADLQRNTGGGDESAVCALCAQVASRLHTLQHIWTINGTDVRQGPVLLSEGVSTVCIPDSFQRALPPAHGYNYCNQKGELCYGLRWIGPLVFSMTKYDGEVQTVCAFCADDNDAKKRQCIWIKAQAVLLEISTGLIPDLVALIGSYFLGRFLDSIPIFAEDKGTEQH